MGDCCSKNGEGIQGLAFKLEDDEEDDDDDDEENDQNRLKFHYDSEDEDEDEGGTRAVGLGGGGGGGARVRLKGSWGSASMYSQQGWKGVNQDAMTIWEEFGGVSDRIFCGVFDGHGPFGHRVACYARDKLPSKLSHSLPHEFQGSNDDDDDDDDDGSTENSAGLISHCKEAFLKAFEELDMELRNHSFIDCICSGSTAVSIVKQREDLIIANLGDSRAIVGTRDEKNELVAVQLTVDLKPSLPGEAERIRRCRGRVFALEEEPDVHRMWMPDEDCPGLAMARAFGDFCLKDFGLISTPQLSCRKLSDKDEFLVLATDGVWDVLTNEEVVKIVNSAATKRSGAAKQVVDRAVRAWRSKHPTSKVDDCAVICLFVKNQQYPTATPTVSSSSSFIASRWRNAAGSRDPSSFSERIGGGDVVVVSDMAEEVTKEEWNALEGLSRVNSLLRMPRIARALSWKRRSVKHLEEEIN